MAVEKNKTLWFEGVILGQKEINQLVEEMQNAKIGDTVASGDTLVVRNEGHTTVYTERFTVWDEFEIDEEEGG